MKVETAVSYISASNLIDGSTITQGKANASIVQYKYDEPTAAGYKAGKHGVLTSAKETETGHGKVTNTDAFGNYAVSETRNEYIITENGAPKVKTSVTISTSHNLDGSKGISISKINYTYTTKEDDPKTTDIKDNVVLIDGTEVKAVGVLKTMAEGQVTLSELVTELKNIGEYKDLTVEEAAADLKKKFNITRDTYTGTLSYTEDIFGNASLSNVINTYNTYLGGRINKVDVSETILLGSSNIDGSITKQTQTQKIDYTYSVRTITWAHGS
ncbi:MAG: hypothetical protein AAB267_00700, partial [Candidatus Desantisbacteria bacterium]